MFKDFVNNAGQYIQTNPWLAVAVVFVGGILTASNPCVLAMIPLMMSFVAGRREEGTGILRAFLYSLVFVLGLSLTFMLLGVIAALAGTMYGDVSGVWNWVVAAVCLVMGLHLMGVLKSRNTPPNRSGMIMRPKSQVAFIHSLTSSRENQRQTMSSTSRPIKPAMYHFTPWTAWVKLGTGSMEAMSSLSIRLVSGARRPSCWYSWMSMWFWVS